MACAEARDRLKSEDPTTSQWLSLMGPAFRTIARFFYANGYAKERSRDPRKQTLKTRQVTETKVRMTLGGGLP